MYNRASPARQNGPDIVVALIVDRSRVFVQPRVGDPGMEALWEFPGGKVEPGEPHAAALVREVREETGLEVAVIAPLVALSHAYPDRRVSLYAYVCGTIAEARSGRWIPVDDVRSLPMPAANPPLIDALAWRLGLGGLDLNSTSAY